jgi:hypothetical protein
MTRDYYGKRKEAMQEIDQLILDGKKLPVIKFYITGKYGFSGKIVDERKQQREELE